MNENHLRDLIDQLGLTQIEFATLLDVTPRAVNTWLSGTRSIPGPVMAYASLLVRLPKAILQTELSRIDKGALIMKDGLYLIDFGAKAGAGQGCLVFDNGQIYGVDTELVNYDGTYSFNISDGKIDVVLKISVPPNIALVQGFISPLATNFEANTKIDPNLDSGFLDVKTSLGAVQAKYKYLRGLPKAA